MAYVECNGEAVSTASIVMPLHGVWQAHLLALSEAKDALTGRVTVAIQGGLTLKGTARRAGLYQGAIPLTVVGGAGGLSKPVAARYYRNVPAMAVLDDILGACGEQLSPTVDGSITSKRLDRWVQPASTGLASLTELLAVLGVTSWRILPDGTLWMGEETWPDSGLVPEVLGEDPRQSEALLGLTNQKLVPGVKLGGRRASRVEHHISINRLTTRAWFTA